MKLILITSPKSIKNRYDFKGIWVVLFLCLLVLLPAGIGSTAYYVSRGIDDPQVTLAIAAAWQKQLAEKQEALTQLKTKSESDIQALTIGLAEAQTRLVRMEALGSNLIRTAKLKEGEFDFSIRPAVGGFSDEIDGEIFSRPELLTEIDNLLVNLDYQSQQLRVLESILANRVVEEEVFLAGRPIKKGWMSSFFGKRIDPFTGRVTQHNGVDFAGEEGSEVISVAAGVVTWSGRRYGYGNLVEIDHGGGFKTRYAHNKENSVETGEIVQRGQLIALMGSTGRSTGPHIHFEVLRNDRPVNPEIYVYR